jgi:hypothetical protein
VRAARAGRKFDLRCWVLLDAEYNVHLYREGVLRTGAVPFSLDDLGDKCVGVGRGHAPLLADFDACHPKPFRNRAPGQHGQRRIGQEESHRRV